MKIPCKHTTHSQNVSGTARRPSHHPATLPRRMRWLFAIALITLAFATPARARELPRWFTEHLHHWGDYKILIISGRKPSREVDRLIAHPDAYRIVAWQALPEDTHPADVQRLLAWVHAGGVLLFQDSRLASDFGFVADPVDGRELKIYKHDNKPYGTHHKYPGTDTLVLRPESSSHPVLAGVDAVQVFLIRVGDAPKHADGQPGGLFSALKQTPGMIPLLKFNPTETGPLLNRVASALPPCGKGTIIFKPLVWEEQFTGGIFQYNLLEWAAGYGVPDLTTNGPSGRKPLHIHLTLPPTGSASPSAKASPAPSSTVPEDSLTLVGDRVVLGRIVDSSFQFVDLDAGLDTRTVKFSDVASLAISEDGAYDRVVLVDGRHLKGSISFPGDLRIREPSGKTDRFKKSEILTLTMHTPGTQKGHP